MSAILSAASLKKRVILNKVMFRNLVKSAALAILLLVACTAWAAAQEPPSNPDAVTIVTRMRQALAPPVPSVRMMTLTVRPRQGSQSHLRLAQARATIDGSNRMLTVVLMPHSQAPGIALLDEETSSNTAVEQIYLPAEHRVQQFTPLHGWQPFFGSDFTYQDFSFFRSSAHPKLAGTELHDGVKAYRLEEIPPKNPTYSKIVTWVVVSSGLPLERDYYDVSDKLYKVEAYEKIVPIQGIPTITKTVMRNVQQDSSSELDVTSIKYHEQAPQKLFDPAYLPKVTSDQFWQKLSQ